MKAADLQKSVHSDRRVFGTVALSQAPSTPSMLVSAGLDFVFIDTEHIPMDRILLSWMCRYYAAIGMTPIVRIPSPDPYQACMALDAGANGIIAPYVEKPEQVRPLYGAVKLRPMKGIRLERRINGGEAFEPELEEYLANRNRENLLVLNIESVPAMEALDDILDQPGVDVVLIGPHDLSCSLGIPEQYEDPRFDEAVCTIIRTARARNIGAGIHCFLGELMLEQEKRWIQAGANFLVHSVDSVAALQGLKREVAELRESVRDSGTAEVGGEIEV